MDKKNDFSGPPCDGAMRRNGAGQGLLRLILDCHDVDVEAPPRVDVHNHFRQQLAPAATPIANTAYRPCTQSTPISVRRCPTDHRCAYQLPPTKMYCNSSLFPYPNCLHLSVLSHLPTALPSIYRPITDLSAPLPSIVCNHELRSR